MTLSIFNAQSGRQQASRQACRQAGCQAFICRKQAGRRACIVKGRPAGRQAGREASRQQAGRQGGWSCNLGPRRLWNELAFAIPSRSDFTFSEWGARPMRLYTGRGGSCNPGPWRPLHEARVWGPWGRLQRGALDKGYSSLGTILQWTRSPEV